MNILFINNLPFNPSLGGIERVTDILTKYLIKNKNHNIFYLSGYVDKIEMLQYDFPVPMHTFPEEGLFTSPKNIEYYNDFIESNNINLIINQRGLEFNFNNSLEIKNVKKITVLHSTPNAYLKSYAKVLRKPYKFEDYIKNFIKILLYPFFVYRNKEKSFKKFEKHYNYLANNSDVIVLLSEHYITEFLSFNIKNKIPIYSIPNPNTYEVLSDKCIEKEKIILFVGRLESQDKNPLQLLRIWNKLHIKYPDWKLLFVGDGPELPKMKSYIQTNKISNVYFEGNKKNVLDYYKKASFVCLTSNYEGWPMALIEGMTAGCVPYTFNSFKAATDIIDDGINGYIINSFNLEEYAHKLSILMENNSKRKQIAKEAQIKVKQFEPQVIMQKWEELFYNLQH